MATFSQVLRYGIIGVGSNIMLYGCYLVLTWIGVGHKLAMTLLYATGVLQTFFFNKRWTFQYGGSGKKAFQRYLLAYGAGYCLNFAVLYVLVDRMSFRHEIVQGAMIVCLAALLFLLQRQWVFPAATGPLMQATGLDRSPSDAANNVDRLRGSRS